MKYYSIVLLTVLFLSVSIKAFTDDESKNLKPSVTSCSGYSILIINPGMPKDSPPVVLPNPKINYKLIITNPCKSEEKNPVNPAIPDNSEIRKWFRPSTRFKLLQKD